SGRSNATIFRYPARKADQPWKLRLERMRGKIDYDGLERSLFGVLEVPQRSRTAGACRRLAAVMTELGWTEGDGTAPTALKFFFVTRADVTRLVPRPSAPANRVWRASRRPLPSVLTSNDNGCLTSGTGAATLSARRSCRGCRPTRPRPCRHSHQALC